MFRSLASEWNESGLHRCKTKARNVGSMLLEINKDKDVSLLVTAASDNGIGALP